MSGPNFFVGNNWLTFWDSEVENFPNVRIDGTPLRQYDTMIDVRTGSVRQYGSYNPPGFTGWQPAGVLGVSNGDPINYGSEVEFTIIDQEGTATAYPTLSLGCLDGTLTTPVKKFTIVMNNDVLYFKQGDVTGSNIMTFDASGNVKIWNNLEVVGDIVLDDITTDVITLKDRIQHDGNITNFIAFETDKMTLDSSGTSIVLDDAAMADKITITGATKFINEINAVPDINLANHIIHLADTNTKIGFPANDQIALATGGTNRVLVTDSRTTIGPQLAIADGAPRILGNMSGSPSSTRLAIQNSTINGNSRFYVIPNGTGSISAINFRNDSAFDDTLPFQAVDFGIVGGESRLTASGSNGSAAPDITFRNNAVEIYRQSATQTTHKATSTNTTTETLFRIIDQNDVPLFYVDGRGGVTSSTTGTAGGSFTSIRCDSGSSDAYFRLARAGTDKWLLRNVSATDNFMLSPDNTDSKGLHMNQTGNVGIGTSTPARKLTVYNSAGDSRILLQNNISGQAINNGFDLTTDGLNASIWNYGNGYMRFAVNNLQWAAYNAGVWSVVGSNGAGNAGRYDVNPNLTNTCYNLRIQSAPKALVTDSALISFFSVSKAAASGGSAFSEFAGTMRVNGSISAAGNCVAYSYQAHVRIGCAQSNNIAFVQTANTLLSDPTDPAVINIGSIGVYVASSTNTSATIQIAIDVTGTSAAGPWDSDVHIIELDGLCHATTSGQLLTFTRL